MGSRACRVHDTSMKRWGAGLLGLLLGCGSAAVDRATPLEQADSGPADATADAVAVVPPDAGGMDTGAADAPAVPTAAQSACIPIGGAGNCRSGQFAYECGVVPFGDVGKCSVKGPSLTCCERNACVRHSLDDQDCPSDAGAGAAWTCNGAVPPVLGCTTGKTPDGPQSYCCASADAPQTCDGVNGRWYPPDYATTGCYKPTRPVGDAGYACPAMGAPGGYGIQFICDSGPPVPRAVGDLRCAATDLRAEGGAVWCCEATVSAMLGCAWTQ